MRAFLFLGTLLVGVAVTFAASPENSADADWTALQAAGVVEFKKPDGLAEMSARDRAASWESYAQLLNQKGLAFYANHPGDPRRWILVDKMLLRSPRFIRSYGPEFEKNPDDVVIDSGAAAAWQIQKTTLQAALNGAVDVPVELREVLDYRSIVGALADYSDKPDQVLRSVDWTPLLSKVATFAARYPASDKAYFLLRALMDHYEATNTPESSAEVWRRFAAGSNQSLAAKARERLQFFQLAARPMELQFTAVDGREVDLAKLRGKVVLVDFWATWCGPCKAELPNVVANYKKYHEQGFEVLGIALEDAHLASADTPEQRSTKLARAKKILTDYTTAHGIPWPQFCDGKYWGSEIVTRYQIGAIPAMFLLDREGQLVTLNARGEALEATLRKLLKL